MAAIRSSRIAGAWYPRVPELLDSLVDRCVDEAPESAVPGKIIALVTPHAGLQYSGWIAAAAYRLLSGMQFDGVLMLGPHHRGGDGLAVIADGGVETPLGVVRIDERLAALLLDANPGIRPAGERHLDEHSLEVQFPFLLRFLPNVPVTPVLMGYQTHETICLASRAIEAAVRSAGGSVLLIASSDLSHYEPRARARRLDDKVVKCLERFDAAGLDALLASNPHHACGGGPMVSILTAARALGATHASVLAYGDSGDTSGDTSAVVGYVSAALYARTG